MGSISGIFDSTVNLLVPALQASATLTVLSRQKNYYDDIANQRISLINNAVSTYVSNIDALVTSGLISDAFGSVPEAAEYVEVDPGAEDYRTINQNLANIPAAERHIQAVNRMNENNDIVRMTAFSPEFLHLAHQSSSTIRDLLHGKLPIDEVINVLTDDAEQAALHGRIGNTARRTHRSLGITRLQMQSLGRRELERQAVIAERVSPVGRHMTVQDLLSTPAQRLGIAITQAQLVQQSLQNLKNSEAAGDPTALGELQLEVQKLTARLAQEAQRGNMVNQFVPNYAALLAPQINSISEALLGSGDRTGASLGGSTQPGGGTGSQVGQSNGKSHYAEDPNALM